MVPHHPPPGGWPGAPVPGCLSWPAAWRRASLHDACSAGAVWQPQAPVAVWPATGGSVWGGGVVGAPLLIGTPVQRYTQVDEWGHDLGKVARRPGQEHVEENAPSARKKGIG